MNKDKEKTLISVKGLCKSFCNRRNNGEHVVLKNICVDINQGDIVCILGLSGGGKSTFLRCLNLLEVPSSGDIFIDGFDVLGEKTDVNKMVGMVFQQFNLFPHLSVYDNITLAPKKIYKKKIAS